MTKFFKSIIFIIFLIFIFFSFLYQNSKIKEIEKKLNLVEPNSINQRIVKTNDRISSNTSQIDINIQNIKNNANFINYFFDDTKIKSFIKSEFFNSFSPPYDLYTKIRKELTTSNIDKLITLEDAEGVFNLNAVKVPLMFLPNYKNQGSKPILYLDSYNDNIIGVTGDGIIFFLKELDSQKSSIQISFIINNLNELVQNSKVFKKDYMSFKDLLIKDDKIYLSLVDEIEENCYNFSILYGELDLHNLEFDYFYKPKDCSNINLNKNFNSHASGGRMQIVGNELIITNGDYFDWPKAQDTKSSLGKLVGINLFNKKFRFISMGHRNPQGLYYNSETNFLISSEHGPRGGDELNIIPLDNNQIYNYGWPISSYGEHYDGKFVEEAPLNKSHSDFGFVEPIKYFSPALGLSEITQYSQNTYILTSMASGKLLKFDIEGKKYIENTEERHELNERVRDLVIKNKNIYLSIESNIPGILILYE